MRALNAENSSHILVRLLHTISDYLTEAVLSMLECELDSTVPLELQEKLERSEKEGYPIIKRTKTGGRTCIASATRGAAVGIKVNCIGDNEWK
jgi:hypothetical protein